MDRLKNLLRTPNPSISYQSIDNDEVDTPRLSQESDRSPSPTPVSNKPLSYATYSIFLWLGVAMLWAWNMFLAAAPYFALRFRTSPWILANFQAAEISVSCVAGFIAMFVLSHFQKHANYVLRIGWALIINIVAFAVLAASTSVAASAEAYFALLMVIILAASLSTGLIQNGLFSFASGYGRKEYVQGIMAGQGVAGVLPPLVSILSVFLTNAEDRGEQDTNIQAAGHSARIYFLTASAVSVLALGALVWLTRQGRNATLQKLQDGDETTQPDYLSGVAVTSSRKTVSLRTLFHKTQYLAVAVSLTFAATMFAFPVFTARIVSVAGRDNSIFIPLAFLTWNFGDFLGRVVTLVPSCRLTHHPLALLVIGVARLVFVPMYLLCNIDGRGAVVPSDAFYLIVVQFLFGLSNGYVGSSCMMGVSDWVAEDEQEAVGGFMGLVMVTGMTVGSLSSFTLGSI